MTTSVKEKGDIASSDEHDSIRFGFSACEFCAAPQGVPCTHELGIGHRLSGRKMLTTIEANKLPTVIEV